MFTCRPWEYNFVFPPFVCIRRSISQVSRTPIHAPSSFQGVWWQWSMTGLLAHHSNSRIHAIIFIFPNPKKIILIFSPYKNTMMSILFSKSKCTFLVMAQPHCWCSRAQWSLGTGSWRSWMMSRNRCKSTKIKKKIRWLFVGNRLSHILVVEFGIGPAAAPAQTAQDKLESPITSAFFFYTLKWMALALWALGPQTCFLFSVQDKWNIIKLGPFIFFFQILPVVGLCTQIETNDGADCFSCWNAAISCLMSVCFFFLFLFASSRNKRRKKTGHQCHSANRPL